MNANIAKKTVVITGASSGMGAAAARHLASQGANVEAFVAEIHASRGRVFRSRL
jgi:NAD(P)-dependent dehydrogenase (short-subunit alcohol dehydrogenase family)